MSDTEKSKTVGEQPRRAAVVIGRFQPPTAGHYSVFNKVKKFIRGNPELKLNAVPICVIVEGKETSKDKERNPLTGTERMSFMKASGQADGIKFLIAGSAYDAFEAVRKAGYEPIAVAAGSDRGTNYLKMLDTYFKTADDEPIQHHLIELPRDMKEAKIDKEVALYDLLRYVDKEMPTSMVSASLARLAVKKGEQEKFAIIVGLADKPKLATLMFNRIKAALGNTE